jgi:spermidine dehydrogenase
MRGERAVSSGGQNLSGEIVKYGKRGRKLGMGRRISRRDFLNGFSVAVGGGLLAAQTNWLEAFGTPQSHLSPQKKASYYPPTLTGMRGSTDAVMQVGHALRDGSTSAWDTPTPDKEEYDLIVVGGGISGLAAAYFYQKAAGAKARVLILENHDDFGGHARRNEFHVNGRMILCYGGTQSIASPKLYSAQSMGMLRELGVDVDKFDKYYDRGFEKSQGLTHGVFFDKETFGTDRMVAGWGDPPSAEFLAKTPLSKEAQADLLRLYADRVDYLPGKSPSEKKAALAKTSYKDFLTDSVRVSPEVITFLQKHTYGLYGVGIEAVPAGDMPGIGEPGFLGMDLSGPPGPGIGLEVTRQDYRDPYIFHFPDGNASIARLLVRRLIPGCAPGTTMEDIVTAKMDYARLDEAGSAVRMRLSSTAIRARNIGDAGAPSGVEVIYVRDGKARSVRGGACVLACWNMVIPHMCPEMPEKQKEALVYGVKVPLVYASVLIRNWEAMKKLGVGTVACPGSYFDEVETDFPVSMGDYQFTRDPREACVLHLQRVPCKAGLPAREQQRVGRAELLTTPSETFEYNVRDQLGRMYGSGGFDAKRDILAITVNRWPHGYAYEYNSLYDPDWPEDQQPCAIGRQAFGRISIANSDAGAFAYTNEAIDQAYRAVNEVLKFRENASTSFPAAGAIT